MSHDSLTLQPIGYLYSTAHRKYQLPPQPTGSSRIEGVVELAGGQNYETALRDLEGFSRIWLVWWFHKNHNWRPTTLPPRGREGRVGTFASRSPYRPNPLAISNVKLLEIAERTLFIGEHDLLDGTPILDIKPYIPEFDSFPEEEIGWYGRMTGALAEPSYAVRFSTAAEQVLADKARLKQLLNDTLTLDPYPHRTRRIVPYGDGFRMACGEWRAYFQIRGKEVLVEQIETVSSISESNSERQPRVL